MSQTPSESRLSRRQALGGLGGLGAAGLAAAMPAVGSAQAPPSPSPWKYCLNTSTIRGQDLPIDQEVEVAGRAGYDAIEPWMGKLHAYREGGGSIPDLRRRIEDHGLGVESAIGFAPWIVDDPERRRKGLEEARRDMDLLARIGGSRIAAAPAGVPRGQAVEPDAAAERYARLLDLGREAGVVPQIEMWGGNPSIGRLGTALYVALESGHPDACFLGDVYHIYKGGSDHEGLGLLGPRALQVFHFNDYPADPPRASIRDEHRIWPGDGIAPISRILSLFASAGAAPVLSLELFNREYWRMDAAAAAETGLAKMKAAVARAGA